MLSKYIFLVSVWQVFTEFQFILVTGFREIFGEIEASESIPGLFSLFYKCTKVCCYEYTQIKVDLSQF